MEGHSPPESVKQSCDMNANSTNTTAYSGAALLKLSDTQNGLDLLGPESDPPLHPQCETDGGASCDQGDDAKSNNDILASVGELTITEGNGKGADGQHSPSLEPLLVHDRNGLTFGESTYVPEELMEIVLSSCDVNSLVKLREVCLAWYRLLQDAYFWRHVMKQQSMLEHWAPIYHHVQDRTDSWKVFYSMVKYRFLDENLVTNPSGADGFTNWTHMSGEVGGWTIDTPEGFQLLGIPKLPPGSSEAPAFCFGTNSFSCSKEQDVDLWQLGLTPGVMKACLPFAITWSELVATPVGHSGIYEAECQLLDSSLGPISPFSPYQYRVRQLIPGGSSWRLFQKRFVINHKNEQEVCDDLRYVHVFHGAMEHGSTQGHWGPRMTSCSVHISLVEPYEKD